MTLDLSKGHLLLKLPPAAAAESALKHYAERTLEPGLGPDGLPQPAGPEDVINLLVGLCQHCTAKGLNFNAILNEAGRRAQRQALGAGTQGARVVT